MGGGHSSHVNQAVEFEKGNLLKAETAAVNLKARTEAEKIMAETAEISRKADTEASRDALADKVWLGVCVAVVGGVAGLAIDYYRHVSPTAIKRRMRAHMLSFAPPPLAAPAPLKKLLVQQPPLFPSTIPTVLLGPSGCGKSTLLAELARSLVANKDVQDDKASEDRLKADTVGLPSTRTGLAPAKEAIDSIGAALHGRKTNAESDDANSDIMDSEPTGPTPTIFVSICLDSDSDASKRTLDSAVKFDHIASKILKQIGYPTTVPLITRLFPGGIKYSDGVFSLTLEPAPQLVQRALGLLFEAAAELCNERVAMGIPRFHAAPVLLFDEMHDLIKDSRLAGVGGREVFAALVGHLVDYGTDKKLVRSVVTASSAALTFEMEKTVASGARYEEYELMDPSEDEVRRALQGRGYSADEATAIVDEVGPRLRQLELALTTPKKLRRPAAYIIESRRCKALKQYESLFSALPREAADATARLLDEMESAAETVGKPLPSFRLIPPAAVAADFSRVAYITLSGGLVFQSRMHRRVWKQSRGQLVSGGDSASLSARPAV